MIETKDLILRKALFEDWQDMYQNVWCREETARYMLWDVTRSEADAEGRMARTITFQQKHPFTYTICEKTSGKAIGFAGVLELELGVYEDCGVALGPEYVGKGYGKQILTALIDTLFRQYNANKLICSCRSQNDASRRLQLACGLRFTHTEERIDPRNNSPYVLEFYELTRDRVPCLEQST